MPVFKKFFKPAIAIPFIIILQSCGIAGVHLKVHNPKKPGKLPEFSEETILLGELSAYRSCFDVYYYDLDLKINPETKSIDGKVEIYAKALKDFDTLQIDLHNNFEITGLSGDNNANLNYQRRQRALFIYYPNKKDQAFKISVSYKGKPIVAKKPPWKGGFVWKKDKKGNPWIGVACESEGASIWWPLKDHTSDEPDSMRMHYTVPEGLMAVANGKLEKSETTNAQSTYHWFVSYPINTYNATVYVGDFKIINETYNNINNTNISLDYYVLEKNYEKAGEHFKQVIPILKTYEGLYGEYPWARDGFKLVESPFAGMEHQSAIAYGNRYKNSANNTDYIILHEIAHEWWGNSVTAADMADVWIQEGFATFSEALYFEKNINKFAYDNHLLLYKWFIKNKFPVMGIENRRWFHYKKSSDVYVKGAWILRTLREQINNDDLFFDIIKSFYENHKYETVKSSDFIAMVNIKTGDDFNWFFNQYLHQNESPLLEYALDEDGILYYRWANVHDEFNQLKITLISNGKEININPSNKIQKLQLQSEMNNEYHFTIKKNVLFAEKENKQLSLY